MPPRGQSSREGSSKSLGCRMEAKASERGACACRQARRRSRSTFVPLCPRPRLRARCHVAERHGEIAHQVLLRVLPLPFLSHDLLQESPLRLPCHAVEHRGTGGAVPAVVPRELKRALRKASTQPLAAAAGSSSRRCGHRIGRRTARSRGRGRRSARLEDHDARPRFISRCNV